MINRNSSSRGNTKVIPNKFMEILCHALLVVVPFHVSSHRILLHPLNINSHFQYFGRMGHGLAREGHEVEMIVPSNGRIPWELETENFTITPYPVETKEPILDSREASEVYLKYALAENKLLAFFEIGGWWMDKSLKASNKDCEDLLTNFELVDRLVNRSKVEFLITDFAMTECHSVLIKALEVPFAILTVPTQLRTVGIPRFPSFVPSVSSTFGDRMTFTERLTNFLVDMFISAVLNKELQSSIIPEYMRGRFELHKSYLDLSRNASLFFLLEDLTVGYPYPCTPDAISVGDISAGMISTKALPQNIDQFLQDKSGVYFSFGSFFNYPSADLTRKFCSAFRQLKGLRIIWKLKNTDVCGSETTNLLILPWVPQKDMLADPRVKVFITHGGFNSIIEAVYHAKPVIVMPIAADQPGQARIAVEKGYGLQMDLRLLTSESLVSNIKETLTNASYQRMAKHYSEILRHRRDTPAERASDAIKGVLRFGNQHLRTSARDLYWFQFMMFDLFLVLSVAILLPGCLVSYVSYRLLKYSVSNAITIQKKMKTT